jgi:anti-sigma factor RsiW
VSVANWTQFEGESSRPAACAVCEAMLPDAVDGTLTAAELRVFDAHVAGCVECARELEEAQRGAAWLGMLKTQTPEVPAGLLSKILAGTTGLEGAAAADVATPPFHDEAVKGWATQSVPAAAPAWAISSLWGRVVRAFTVDGRATSFQPRLAMTAAMAFFSVALTLNLTGVKVRDLRAASFTPSGMRRTVADMSASATRSFQNLRVVYQVESRVSDLRESSGMSDGRQPNEVQPQEAPQQQPAPNPDDAPKKTPKPQGSSDLVLPAPGRTVRAGAAARNEV